MSLGATMTSPEPLPPAQTLRLDPVLGVAKTTIVLLVAVCVVDVFATWTAWTTYRVVDDYVSGVPGVGIADLVGADNATTSAWWLRLLAVVAAAAALMTWVWRARLNAERINAAEHRLSRGWAIGSWFCPVVNLWFPKYVLDDIWRTSRPGVPTDAHRVEGLEQSRLVHVWWYAILANAVLSLALRLENVGPLTPDSLRANAVYCTIQSVVIVFAAALLIQVIRQITRWQSIPREARAEDWRRA
jgi:uncharacterized protein DUF4328